MLEDIAEVIFDPPMTARTSKVKLVEKYMEWQDIMVQLKDKKDGQPGEVEPVVKEAELAINEVQPAVSDVDLAASEAEEATTDEGAWEDVDQDDKSLKDGFVVSFIGSLGATI